MMTSNVNMPDYGAVERDELHVPDRTFDENQAYYLKNDQLTAEERWRKLLRMGVPLVVALLLVGGAALLLSKNFRNLYPGGGQSSSNGGRGRVRPAPPPESRPSMAPISFEAPDYPVAAPESPDAAPESPVAAPESPVKARPSLHKSNAAAPIENSKDSSACLAHKKCWELNLEGECCPTPENVTLECCS